MFVEGNFGRCEFNHMPFDIFAVIGVGEYRFISGIREDNLKTENFVFCSFIDCSYCEIYFWLR